MIRPFKNLDEARPHLNKTVVSNTGVKYVIFALYDYGVILERVEDLHLIPYDFTVLCWKTTFQNGDKVGISDLGDDYGGTF